MKRISKNVCGVGINDLPPNLTFVNQMPSPLYVKWASMLVRCYSKKALSYNPTYSDCYVCEEWKYLSGFYSWYKEQSILSNNPDYQLDKDLYVVGNKIYEPNKCFFVPKSLNLLVLDGGSGNKIREYPKGVSFHKASRQFRATLSIHNKPRHLGTFDSVVNAKRVYDTVKSRYIMTEVMRYKISTDVSMVLLDAIYDRAKLELHKNFIESDMVLFNKFLKD